MNNDLLTTSEVLKLLKISRTTLYNWRESRIIKPVKFGKSIRYKRRDVNKILMS